MEMNCDAPPTALHSIRLLFTFRSIPILRIVAGSKDSPFSQLVLKLIIARKVVVVAIGWSVSYRRLLIVQTSENKMKS